MTGELTLPVEQFTQTRYRCPYCRRSWTSLKRANEHRDKCWYNHGCKTCQHADTIGGAWVQGCDAGVDLFTDPGSGPVLRSQCPLWEAMNGAALASAP